jgi:hypothetical protein
LPIQLSPTFNPHESPTVVPNFEICTEEDIVGVARKIQRTAWQEKSSSLGPIHLQNW